MDDLNTKAAKQAANPNKDNEVAALLEKIQRQSTSDLMEALANISAQSPVERMMNNGATLERTIALELAARYEQRGKTVILSDWGGDFCVAGDIVDDVVINQFYAKKQSLNL